MASNSRMGRMSHQIYQCTVCNKSTIVDVNPYGVNLSHQCSVTLNCPGMLKLSTSTPSTIHDTINRVAFYQHTQTVESNVWKVVHNLGSVPVLHVFTHLTVDSVVTLTEVDTFSITPIDKDTVAIAFDRPQSGIVHCIATASAVNSSSSSTIVNATNVQVTTDDGLLTLATISPNPLVNIRAKYMSSNGTSVSVDYVGVTNAPQLGSPWVGASEVLVSGKRYYVRTLHVTKTPLAPSYFTSRTIQNGAEVQFSAIDGTTLNSNDMLLLLGTSPYTAIDRITDTYINAGNSNVKLFYDTGTIRTTSASLQKTYPYISPIK